MFKKRHKDQRYEVRRQGSARSFDFMNYGTKEEAFIAARLLLQRLRDPPGLVLPATALDVVNSRTGKRWEITLGDEASGI